MRQKYTVTYLQKPKRIRKRKKEFLRGNRERVERKVSYQRTIIPLPYILLFAFLAVTIIGYTSTSFLLTRIHVHIAPLYASVTSLITSIPIPHIIHPSVPISLPKIPEIALPSINLSMPLRSFTQATSNVSLRMASYFNPLPFWAGVFGSTVQFLAIALPWIFIHTKALTSWLLQNAHAQGTSILVSLHPIQGMQTGATALLDVGVWVFGVLRDYLTMVGTMISMSEIFLLHTAFIIWNLLITGMSLVMNMLLETTRQQLALHYQTLTTTITFLELALTYTTHTMVSLSVWIWDSLGYVTISIIGAIETLVSMVMHGVVLILQGIVHVMESILGFIVDILLGIFDWIVRVLMAIKKSIDMTLGSFGAFIHLGDPVYIVIASSIHDLVSSMGTTMSFMPNILK